MKVRRSLLKDTVSVETFAGTGAYGPSYATAASVQVLVELKRRLVRGFDGKEQVSELTLTVHPDDAAKFTPESRVTYNSRVSAVLQATPETVRGYETLTKVYCS